MQRVEAVSFFTVFHPPVISFRDSKDVVLRDKGLVESFCRKFHLNTDEGSVGEEMPDTSDS